eukprot:scaffold206842_cov66-Attheya_sp.AAC.1
MFEKDSTHSPPIHDCYFETTPQENNAEAQRYGGAGSGPGNMANAMPNTNVNVTNTPSSSLAQAAAVPAPRKRPVITPTVYMYTSSVLSSMNAVLFGFYIMYCIAWHSNSMKPFLV